MSEYEPDARTRRSDRPIDGGSPDHARIDELLAGHALHALEGDDLREVEGILAEHLPTCDRCRDTVEEFRAISADLAFASRPAAPPEVLLPRLQRETLAIPIDEREAPPSRPRRALGSWLSAAAALMLVALVLWNAFLHVRLQDVTATQTDLTRVTHFMSQPDAQKVALESARPASRVLIGYREAQVALFGSDIPEPAKGNVYRLWVGHRDRFVHVTDFRPRSGVVAVLLEFDARKYDQIFVTEESSDVAATDPNGKPIWSATLRPDAATTANADEQAA